MDELLELLNLGVDNSPAIVSYLEEIQAQPVKHLTVFGTRSFKLAPRGFFVVCVGQESER